jgi:TatD DNase family protein
LPGLLILIDTHCHLDVERFDADREAVLSRAWASGVKGLVIPAIGPTSWRSLLEYPKKDPRIQVALGIHPQLLPELAEPEDVTDLGILKERLSEGGAVAVGECGLDGPSTSGAPMARQLDILKAHFELAVAFDLPVLVHCLRAHEALQNFLKTHEIPRRGILLHSYSGSHELVKFYAKHRCWFSFAGPITFENARRPVEALRAIPRERLMVETDAPDQTPHPVRGQRCEPSQLHYIVKAMATHLGDSAENVAQQTAHNARLFFQAF